MKLYELTNNYSQVWDMLNNDDADLQTIEDTLQSIEASIEIKAQNTVSLIKNLDMYSNGLSKEIERLEQMQDDVNHKIDVVRNYMFSQLDLTGLSEVKTSIATIKKQKNPASVEILDDKLIPSQYLTVIPESYKPRKADIARDLKLGTPVAGCELKQSQRWVIK